MRSPYLNTLKYVLEGSRNDASLAGGIRQALHGEGLPTACLAICKNGTIVALSDTLCEREPQPAVQLAGLYGRHGPQPPAPGPLPGSPLHKAPLCPRTNGLMGLNTVPKGRCLMGELSREPTRFKLYLHARFVSSSAAENRTQGLTYLCYAKALPPSHTHSPTPLFTTRIWTGLWHTVWWLVLHAT